MLRPLYRALAPTAVLLACLVVQASGAPSIASTTRQQPAAPAADAATAATPLLLLNGDQVLVSAAQGGPYTAGIKQGPGTMLTRSLLRLRVAGRGFLIPMAALPYLGHGLDMSLFDVSGLQRAESAGRLPVTLRFHGSMHQIPGVTVTHTGTGVAQGYLTASSARVFGAALARQMMADHANGSYGADGMFASGMTISLPGASAAPARPQFPMHVLTVTGTNLAGKPDTGDLIDVLNLNDLAAFGSGFESENDFFHGTTKFSVPDGTYWGIGTFFGGAGFRLDVLPQFTVSGNTTEHVSEQAASSKVDFVTPRRATPQDVSLTIVRGTPNALASFGFEAGGPGASIWVNPTSKAPSEGTLHEFTSDMLASIGKTRTPYDYQLNFAGPAGIIPAQHFVVHPRDLATASERYYQDRTSTGGWQTVGGTAYQLSTSFIGGLIPQLKLPGRQIQYISARPAMYWSSNYFEFYSSLAGGQAEPFRLLHGGQQVSEKWGRYPLHPGVIAAFPHTAVSNLFPVEPSAVRAGNKLTLDITPFSDNQFGHLGSGFSSSIFGGGPKVTGSYALYQNGKKIAGGDAAKAAGGGSGLFLQANLSAKASTIKFALSASRAAGGRYLLSPASSDVWTWRSAPDAKAAVPAPWYCAIAVAHGMLKFDRHCVVQQMLALRYNVAGLSLSGQASPGHQVVHITVGHLQEAAAPAIRHVSVQVSFDGGKTWHKAGVRRTGTRVRATFSAAKSSHVTLRVGVRGKAGVSLTETIFRAYQTAA